MGRRSRSGTAHRPAREHFYFVGAQEGGCVPLSGANLLLDANVVSFGEAIMLYSNAAFAISLTG